MEKRLQLPQTDGGCWGDVSRPMAEEESNPKVAFLHRYLSTAMTRGDMKYLLNVVEDLTLTMLQTGEPEMAKMLSDIALNLRNMDLAERKAKEKAGSMTQNLVLVVKDGKLSVENLDANKVFDIHHNGDVNVK